MISHHLVLPLAALFGCLVAPGGPLVPSPSNAAAPLSDATMGALRGCWSSDPVADGRGVSNTYCFDPAGYLGGSSIAYGTGGDFCVRWMRDGPKALLLYFSPDPDACGFAGSPDGQSFDLSNCREAGHFRRDAEFDLTSWPCDAANLDF